MNGFCLFLLLPLVQVVDVSMNLLAYLVNGRFISDLLHFPLQFYLMHSLLQLLLLLQELVLLFEEILALFLC